MSEIETERLGDRIFREIDIAKNRLHGHYDKYFLSRFIRNDDQSKVPVTLMVPVARKDVDRARVSIPRMIEHVAHPIERTIVVSPETPEILRLCRDLNLNFVDEMGPLTGFLGRSTAVELPGWYRQQVLKLIAPGLCGSDNVVTIDSDTYPIRPTAFITDDDRTILRTVPLESHFYHRFTKLLIGPALRHHRSFIAHCMVFRTGDLDLLQRAMERHSGKPWVDTLVEHLNIPLGRLGVLSEFDLLGHTLMRDKREGIQLRHCGNLKVTAAQFLGTQPLPRIHRRFRFLSNHQHGT